MFFVFQFDAKEDYNHVINDRPWFWGRAGLFVTPWFPGFDANSMMVYKMPVWVRLHNLPLHFWHHLVLESIKTSLGRFLKLDRERMEKGIFTFARICVEMDLSKGLPKCIHLTHKDFKWTQCLDFENNAFRCRVCHQIGHLQNTCNQAKKKTKKRSQKPKGWQFQEPPSSDEEDEEKDETQQQPETEKQQDSQEEGKEKVEEENKQAENSNSSTIAPNTEIPLDDKNNNQGTGGVKRSHVFESSDSDKEAPNISKNNN